MLLGDHTCIHTYIHTCQIKECKHDIYMLLGDHTYIHTYIHTCQIKECRHAKLMNTYIHTYTHKYIHTQLRPHRHIHAYIHTYILTHMNTHAIARPYIQCMYIPAHTSQCRIFRKGRTACPLSQERSFQYPGEVAVIIPQSSTPL
jgi:hypothetical protein